VAQLKDKIENALNETRILVLGGQVLIGFNYESFFEAEFHRLSAFSQSLLTISLALLLAGLALLLLPMPYHYMVEGRKISDRLHQLVTVVAHWALFAFGFALAARISMWQEKPQQVPALPQWREF
jgi:Family of unknown function (DUF6328)